MRDATTGPRPSSSNAASLKLKRAVNALLKRNPGHAKGQNLLGVVCASLGDHDCARAAFEASLASNPRDSSAYVNLGYLSLERGIPRRQTAFFSEALAIDTTSEAARNELSKLANR